MTYCRLPRDLLSITPRPISITPRPIIDYPVPYYRLRRDLLSISPEKEMPQVLLNQIKFRALGDVKTATYQA